LKPAIITLLTDFGTQDYFAGAMKGVILSINPEARIVDLTHEIPPQDIQAGAFNLLCCYRDFPAGAIHVAVVDPGVGSDRKPILVECANQFFIGPDNGIFSWICEREGNWRALHLTRDRYFRHPVSNTFHGRDVFAPIAAVLSNGVSSNDLGVPLSDIVRLEALGPRHHADGTIEGRVLHIDRFGNCVTNLSQRDLAVEGPASWKLLLNNQEVTSLRQDYAGGSRNTVFAVVGSAGLLELSARNDSAAEILEVERGQSLILVPGKLTPVAAKSN
jgi:S-adenosyl-L-methionine hydrolase (adenosine-forming)